MLVSSMHLDPFRAYFIIPPYMYEVAGERRIEWDYGITGLWDGRC